MIRRATLYARFSEPSGNYPRIAVEFGKHGQAIKPQPPAGGHLVQYQIRINRKFISVGTDLLAAVNRLRLERARIEGGVSHEEAAPASEPRAPEKSEGRARIAEAAAEFVHELRTLNRNKYTVDMYANVLRDFQRSCRKTFIDEIDRADILAFIAWMRENLQVRVPGAVERTLRNKTSYIGTFLLRHGIQLKKRGSAQGKNDAGLLYRGDMPKPMRKKPRKYDRDEIDALMKHADTEQRDYLEFLLWSGFRDEEVQFLQYSDFNFRNSTVLVQAKPQFGWKPKDNEERAITLPTQVSQRFKDRMSRPQRYADGFRKPTDSDIVFPNSLGTPDVNLIDRLHAVAEKAGLNLRGKRAGHMFRKTAGSRVAKTLGLPAAMEFLGHSDIKTTALYLAADTSDLKRKRQLADEMYAKGD
jgi:integrase